MTKIEEATRNVSAIVLIKEQIIFEEARKKEKVESELWSMLIDWKKRQPLRNLKWSGGQKLNVTIEEVYSVLGLSDFVAILSGPNTHSLLRAVVELRKLSNVVDTNTVIGFSPETYG